jgi:hypothetical protein
MNTDAANDSRTWTLRALPPALRVLLSAFLVTVGLGYVAALLYLFLIDVEPHRKMGMGLVDGITTKYYGTRGASRLEASLRGPMADKLEEPERERIFRWLRGGAQREGFEMVKPIFAKSCMTCHSAGSPFPQLAPLSSYDEVVKFAQLDTGPSVAQLARVSHVHLFGISIIFLLTGAIFAMSAVRLALRIPLLVLPYLAMWIDIGSWWVTRFAPAFAYTVIAGGALMSIALALQITLSLGEMWAARLRPAVAGPG